MAGLTLNAGGGVLAGLPLVRRRFVARRAQRRIRRDGHLYLRMVRLIRAVTGFTRNALEFVCTIGWVVARRVALQACVLIWILGPSFLKNR